MSNEDSSRAEREAKKFAHEHTQRDEGRWLGTVDGEQPVARELIRRYNEVSKDLRACPHLQKEFDQARFWVEAVPEFLACQACTPALAEKEQKQANTLCLMCRKHVELRGVSVAVGGVLMRCGLCQECAAEYELEP